MLMKSEMKYLILLLWVMGFLLFLPSDVRVIYPDRVNCRGMVVRLGEVEHMGAVTREKAAGNDKGHKYLVLPGSGSRRGELALQITW